MVSKSQLFWKKSGDEAEVVQCPFKNNNLLSFQETLKAFMPITFSSPRAKLEVVYFFDIKWKAIFFWLQIQNFSFKFFEVLEI